MSGSRMIKYYNCGTVYCLVGGLEHFICFHSVGTFIIPTDVRIFFRGVGPNHQPVAVSYFQKCPCGIGARVLIPPKKWGWWGCCAWWLLTKAKGSACVCWSCSPKKSWLNLCVSWCQLCQHLWRLNLIWLVVTGTCLFFHSVGNFIIPTDFHSMIFQRGSLNHQPGDYSPSLAIYYPYINHILTRIAI